MGLADIKTVKEYRELFEKGDMSMFDNAPSYEEQMRPRLNDNLSDEELKDAIHWHRFMRGVMLVSGRPGAGKGLFQNVLAWKAKRYYEDKLAILDYKPRELFGFYIPFNLDMLVEQLERMKEAAGWDERKFNSEDEVMEFNTVQNKRWESVRGEIFLNNSIMVLDEFHEYMDRRRRPPVGLILGDIFKFWRHLRMLCVGVTTRKADLDFQRFQKALTAEVRCSWSIRHPSSTIYKLQPMQFEDDSGGVVAVRGAKIRRRIDGAQRREALNGRCYFDLFNSLNVKGISIPKSILKELRHKERMEA